MHEDPRNTNQYAGGIARHVSPDLREIVNEIVKLSHVMVSEIARENRLQDEINQIIAAHAREMNDVQKRVRMLEKVIYALTRAHDGQVFTLNTVVLDALADDDNTVVTQFTLNRETTNPITKFVAVDLKNDDPTTVDFSGIDPQSARGLLYTGEYKLRRLYEMYEAWLIAEAEKHEGAEDLTTAAEKLVSTLDAAGIKVEEIHHNSPLGPREADKQKLDAAIRNAEAEKLVGTLDAAGIKVEEIGGNTDELAAAAEASAGKLEALKRIAEGAGETAGKFEALKRIAEGAGETADLEPMRFGEAPGEFQSTPSGLVRAVCARCGSPEHHVSDCHDGE